VQMLLDARADANALEERYGNASCPASVSGYERVLRMLLDAKADVDAQGGKYGNALQNRRKADHGLSWSKC